jgi:P27 family predicted phage terminase small subunit
MEEIMRGRKPIPSKVIDIRGGSKHTHRPPRTDEPQPSTDLPKCPSFLDKEAKKEWRRMIHELKDTGILTSIDGAILARYADNYSKWKTAEQQLQKMPMVRFNPTGFAEINPYFRIANKAKEMMIKDLVEMGMTPSARSRVKVSGQKPKEEKSSERFFKKG